MVVHRGTGLTWRKSRTIFFSTVPLDQRSEAINGFSDVDGLGVETDFFDFCVGTHHEVLAQERNREHSIRDQVMTLNMGVMEHLRSIPWTTGAANGAQLTHFTKDKNQQLLVTTRQ